MDVALVKKTLALTSFSPEAHGMLDMRLGLFADFRDQNG